jgi:argininosuccinate lyase
MKLIHEKLSARGLSEKDINEALDPAVNVNKRTVTGGPAPKETKRQVSVLSKKLGSIAGDIMLMRKKVNAASGKLEKACNHVLQV